ncbi:putative FAD-dependent pyridine nucleotide reductase [Streptomyces sparsogenes DSM 40356]|uniref:Putative FAD-dependent pyridine nucleotide reductase n=1 Tax=Streptomyces sparsogenes DSM 40356 TaxID=1331668 RepID=A0A1R1SIS4_9ACTN|nr:putative FAD-dependent pyridine nucleotide reductase [Streptomyces sparsogenes DSM 40356]
MVVVGGGMAGTRLAQQLAATAAEGGVEVTVIGEEPHPAYNRVLLAEVLAGRYAPDVIALPAPAAARRLGGVRAVRIDRDPGEVVCDDGRRVPYDSLVLATGSNPVLPPLRGLFGPHGHELPDGVHAFRTMDDCLALAAAVRPGVRAVVIGGGLLGVSAARALAQRGAQVVLAHQGEHLMERQLDAGASEVLRRHVETLGVEVHTECRVRGLRTRPPEGGGSTADGGGKAVGGSAVSAVSAVELADGYALEADLVVLACGVRPRVGLARAAGLEVARGVVVDDELRTSDPRVFAIGDCAEHDGVLYGLAGPAQDQADMLARVLGHRAAHGHETGPRYKGSRTLTRLTLAAAHRPLGLAPLDLAAFGETTPAPGDDVVHLADATRNAYRKVVVRGDRLVGGILLGDLGSVGALARTWEGDEPLPSAPLLHLLTNDGGS